MPSSFNSDSLLITLGNRIRSARKNIGWTQEELADFAELDRSYIGGIERGERNITFLSLCQIAKALRIDVANLTQNLPEIKNDK